MNHKKTSIDRKNYLRKIRNNKIAVIVTQIVILLGIIILWEVLANYGIIDSFIASQPSRIWNTFLNLSSNHLVEHIGVTVLETVIGFTLGTFLGIIIAILLWWSRFLSKVMEPFLVILTNII